MARIDRIIPLLVYDDIAAAHDFLVEAFGFESGGVERNAEGKPVHAEVRAGGENGQVIWIHRVTAEHAMASPRSAKGDSSGLVVYVDDVDAHHARARAKGAQIDSAPEDRPYGLREYGARDPEGHRWWFASPVK
jgi:uncharacterized glyoxalase superfamily protein PhnB